MSTSAARFRRGIKKGSKAYSLSKDFFSTSLGEQLLSNTQFKICIRNNYFNIYWNGCSILKYSPLARVHIYNIHHKYVGIKRPTPNNPYVDLSPKYNNDTLCDLIYGDWSFSKEILGTDRNGQMSSRVEEYIKGGSEDSEKKNLSQYLKANNPCWLDLEVAFSRKSKNTKGEDIFVADRIDLAVIEDTDTGKPVLKFIEVKMANDSRLKKKDNELPSVCEKMRIYKNSFIDDQRDSLFESYRVVAQNMIDFRLANDRMGLIERWIDGGVVAPYPYLLVLSAKNTLADHHYDKIDAWMKANGYPLEGLICHHPG